MKLSIVFLLISLVFFLSGCTGMKELTVYDLKCENLHNPLGIDSTTPRFSWKTSSSTNGTEQKAWQLMVASDPALLQKNQPDLWDSQKIHSAASILVAWQGQPLAAGQAACWKVRIWDETGTASPWSPTAGFSVGLLRPEDWQASYIGFPTEAGQRECPQVKQSFNLDETGKRSFLHVNSLGYHEVWLNGQKVGEGVLTPAMAQFNKRSRIITYDVTTLVKKGRNDLMLWLGSGWYTEGAPGVVSKGPLVRAQLEQLSGNNKRTVVLSTDASWTGRISGYQRNINWKPPLQFGSERLDGALARTDLLTDNTAGRPWAPVTVVAVPDHLASPQMVELNRIMATLKPVEIRPLADNTWLVDMGQTLTGWFEIQFPKLPKAQEIILDYADHLNDKGQPVNQNQSDRYIAAGEGAEIFRNKFNYQGFRYIRISNLPAAPATDSIRAHLIHTGYELAAGFQCSDPDMNKIHDMIFYTLRCLSLGGYLVDCPHIERLGYGGDGNASTQTAQTMFNLNPLYANWLQAWSDCVRDDGGMPHTAPNPWSAGGGPYWCGFIITASWRSYQNYGDAALLQQYYPVMQQWLGYAEKYSPDGLLKKWPDTDYRGWYLGDWACPEGVDQTAEASVDLVNNCFMVVCYDSMRQIAQALNKPADAELYLQKTTGLQTLIHQKFYDPAKNSYATGAQIDLAYPMLAGVVPAELTAAVTASLVNETEVNRKGHFGCGLVGIPVLTEWAVNNQAAELIYSMLKKKTYPGYLYMLENGATTTWEHWNGARSRIHNCYNGIGSWFYQALGGIRPNPDSPAYRSVLIQPQIPQGITWARTFKETPYGKLVVNWELKDAAMELYVEIPVGIDADIAIPAGVKTCLLNDKECELPGDKVKSSIVSIKSGKYRISYKR